MALKINKRVNVCTVRIDDELTIFKVAEYRPKLLAAAQGMKKLKVDLRGTTEVDTAGVQLLLALEKQLITTDNEFELVEPSAAVDNVLKTLNLAEHFTGAANR